MGNKKPTTVSGRGLLSKITVTSDKQPRRRRLRRLPPAELVAQFVSLRPTLAKGAFQVKSLRHDSQRAGASRRSPRGRGSEVRISIVPRTGDQAEGRGRLASVLSVTDCARFHVHCDAVLGQPAKAIVDHAIAINADLIVMGTHGRTGLAHLLMGSVAEHVVRAATCPVLTVRERACAEEALPAAANVTVPLPVGV